MDEGDTDMSLFLMIVLFVVAIIPAVMLMLLVYFSDKIEREPVGLVLALIGMGVLSTIPAILWECIGDFFLSLLFRYESIVYLFIENFFLVAVAEETCKFLCMFVITWKNKAFDYAFDGIIYAVATSLGFAGIENLLYVFSNVTDLGVYQGFIAGIDVGMTRAFLAVPLHTAVAIFMGYFYGRAKEATFQHKMGRCWLFIGLALLVPMLIHGFYDFLLSVAGIMNTGGALLTMLLFGIFVIFMYVFTISMNIYFSKHDHNITGKLKIKVTKDGWLRYAITDNREVMIMGLTKPYQGNLLVIPEELDGYPVRIISRSAFAYTNIVNIKLPKNLRIIEDTAFFNCPYLTNVILPDQLVSIGNYSFEYCYNIRRFLIPHIKMFGNHVFDGCDMLTDIYYLGNSNEWRAIRMDIRENQKLLAVRFYYNAIRQ
jgi:RsiW-degrading membrane proteinase PrsW (M82 family)